MSNSNDNPNPQKANAAVEINENGEIVIKDPELAQALQELTPEELEVVVGGLQEDMIDESGIAIIFLSAIAIGFTIQLRFFYEFNDWYASYTGFGINMMMSILFIAMLLRRDSIDGQSLYIALFKWLGTLFALFSTAFDAYAELNIPIDFYKLLIETITHENYPFTPLVKILYYFTFMFDLIYIVLLYNKIKEANINPWARF